MFNSQAGQDRFIVNVLKGKQNGFFLEIGSHDAVYINNSFVLEKIFNWKGIMIEYNEEYLESYKTHRPNSIHVINDARNIDYLNLFKKNNAPNIVDYLQIDVEAANGSTIEVLRKVEKQLMSNYRFSVVTFEHDIYNCGEYLHTRTESREIFERNGYKRVFDDVNDNNPDTVFEDWYVHPDLVDMDYVNKLAEFNKTKYVNPKKTSLRTIVPVTINYKDIVYPNTLPLPDSIIVVGASSQQKKTIMLSKKQQQMAKKARDIFFYASDAEVFEPAQGMIPDTFSGKIESDRAIVTRTDKNSGWCADIIGKMVT